MSSFLGRQFYRSTLYLYEKDVSVIVAIYKNSNLTIQGFFPDDKA